MLSAQQALIEYLLFAAHVMPNIGNIKINETQTSTSMGKEEVTANSLGRKGYVLDMFSAFVPSDSLFLRCSFSSVTYLEILPHCHMILLADKSLKIIEPCCFHTVWVLMFSGSAYEPHVDQWAMVLHSLTHSFDRSIEDPLILGTA